MNQLEGKIIIVTGGSGLLGSEMIRLLSSRGAIAINFEKTTDTSEDLLNISCDITSDKSIKKALYLVMQKYGRIDGLVNNAFPRTKDWGKQFCDETPAESFRKNIDMQLNSYAILCQEVLKIMAKQSSGSIINIGSIYGVVGNDFTIYENTEMMPEAAYAAIKGGIISLTRYLAAFHGKNQIRINCVSPGGIFDNQNQIFVDNYERRVPLKRMGNPDDISGPVAFLLSNDAKYITGQNLIVDGGWTSI
jgi:NAD(P)-dependent dehydrogenase (short-subunit alcohol dehydrogenase family)